MLKAQWTQELSAFTKVITFKFLIHVTSSYITNLDQNLASILPQFQPKSLNRTSASESKTKFSFKILAKI